MPSPNDSRAHSCTRYGANVGHGQTKFKWGSRPQYGDWGISQPASATSLKHLAGRLRAFVDRAMSGRGFSGGGGRVSIRHNALGFGREHEALLKTSVHLYS